MILVGSVGFCLAGEGGPSPRDASGKKKPTKKWARNTGSNVSNVVLNT